MAKKRFAEGRNANYSIGQNALYLLGDIQREKPQLFWMLAVQFFCGSVLPLFGLYLPKIAVDLVTQGAPPWRLLATLGGLAALYILLQTADNTAGSAKYMQYNRMRTFYQRKILLRSLDCDYDQLESEAGQTRFQKARRSLDGGDWSGTSRMVTAGMALCTGTVSFLLYSGVVAALNPLILLLLAAVALVNYAASQRGRKYAEKHRGKLADFEKKERYIQNAASDLSAAKEVRLYGLADWFLAVRAGVMADYKAVSLQIARRQYFLGFVTLFTNLLRDGISYGYLIYKVTNGGISPGDALLYFGAIAGFSGWIGGLAGNFGTLAEASSQMNDMRDFFEFSNRNEPENPALPPDLDKPVSIAFENVAFSYDGENFVLNGVNLSLHPGEKLALVGVNGAGKTTLVKLLCGFYRPDAGKIRINGTDIAQLKRQDLFRLFSVVFQDISLFPFTVAENISLQPEEETDLLLAEHCLQKAGLWAEINQYPQGMQAKMLKALDENGVVLSGGQQQKLLMARALYKNAPVLLLDEPTAALDPIAESEVYEQFHALSQNKTAIYISHRLASTRFCDKIAFLKDGVVSELGTHAQLMAQNGDYAQMFAVQSHYYRKGGETHEG